MKSRIRTVLFGMLFVGLSFTAPLAQTTPQLHQIGPALNHPWGMDFISATEVLVTERGGALYRMDIGSGATTQIGNLPSVAAGGQGGLLDVMVAEGHVYLCYAKADALGVVTAIDRAVLGDNQLMERRTIFASNNPSWSSVHFGCRLAMSNGHLFASFGERGKRENAQDATVHDGAIIRLLPDGTVPPDNPKIDGWAPGIYSIGHRNPQGMAVHPTTNEVWTHEHGPKGGDEINIINKGENYGWPVVSHGNEYGGNTPVSKYKTRPGITDPEWVWVPSIAPSGMAFYPTGNGNDNGAIGDVMFPELAGNLLVGSLKFRRLYSITLNAAGLPQSERVTMENVIGRIRDVAVADDGSILLLNDMSTKTSPPGGLYRISR